jgi:hypothetical protein
VTWILADAASQAFNSPVQREIMLVLHDSAWVGLRDSLAVGAAAVVLSLVLRSFAPRESTSTAFHSSSPPDWPVA